jgi:hypothetical protein
MWVSQLYQPSIVCGNLTYSQDRVCNMDGEERKTSQGGLLAMQQLTGLHTAQCDWAPVLPDAAFSGLLVSDLQELQLSTSGNRASLLWADCGKRVLRSDHWRYRCKKGGWHTWTRVVHLRQQHRCLSGGFCCQACVRWAWCRIPAPTVRGGRTETHRH